MIRERLKSMIRTIATYTLIAVCAIAIGVGSVYVARKLSAPALRPIPGDFASIVRDVGQGKPVMVVLQGCPHCADARTWLASKKMSVREVEIGSDDRIQTVLAANQIASTPTLILPSSLVVGFLPEVWDGELRKYGN